MDDHREWEKARQVVKAIQRIMVGDGEMNEGDPTPENPVVATSSLSGKVETRIKKVLNVDYETRVKDLEKQQKQVEADGAAAIERLKAKWAEKT